MENKPGRLFITDGDMEVIGVGVGQTIYVNGKPLGDLIANQLGMTWKQIGSSSLLKLGRVRIWVERLNKE